MRVRPSDWVIGARECSYIHVDCNVFLPVASAAGLLERRFAVLCTFSLGVAINAFRLQIAFTFVFLGLPLGRQFGLEKVDQFVWWNFLLERIIKLPRPTAYVFPVTITLLLSTPLIEIATVRHYAAEPVGIVASDDAMQFGNCRQATFEFFFGGPLPKESVNLGE